MRYTFCFLMIALQTILLPLGTAAVLPQSGEIVDQYIINHKEIAISEMMRSGVPASIKLAQGMLESDWGRSTLATTANNHFGIKCGSQWTGETYYKEDDDKDRNGKLIKSCFRAFKSTHESYVAHSDFLSDPRKEYRYGFLFNYETTDYKSWAHGLKKSGYATDPKYPNKLIQIIEKYELDQFDAHVELSSDDAPVYAQTSTIGRVPTASDANTTTKEEINLAADLEVIKVNGLKTVISNGQASVNDIAEEHNRSVASILEFNELFPDENYIPRQGIKVFVQRKRSSYSGKNKYHVVVEGETMASISHQYGMKLRSLYIKNRMPDSAEPLVGEKLALYRTYPSHKKPKYTVEGIEDGEVELLFLDDPTLR